jgi:hypothetical protein
MGFLGDIIGGIAGLASDDGSGGAFDYYRKLADQYAAVNPNITPQSVQVDQPTRAAQLSALSDLQGIYGQGGLDAIGRSRIAQANTETNRNAMALANSIGERARASGNANSGVTLALQQQAGQDAAERARQSGMDAAAIGEQTRLGALGQAGQLSTAAGEQQNAIDRYNAMARQTAQQDTFTNRLNQLSGQGRAYGAGYAAKNTGYGNTVGAWSSLGNGAGGVLGGFGLSKYLGF